MFSYTNIAKTTQKFKKITSLALLFTIAFASVLVQNVSAATPVVETTIQRIADGQQPFDANTYDPVTGNFGGDDSSSTNGIVRILDYIHYKVEVSLNHANDTNLRAAVTLVDDNVTDDIQTWDAIPTGCLTTGVTPVSQITNNGKTLICNFGDRLEGNKFSFTGVARVNQFGKQGNQVWATVAAQGDTATVKNATSNNTLVTTSFKIDLIKTVPGDPNSPTYVDDYSPDYTITGPTGQSGALVEFIITLKAQPGSELIQNASGLANFSLVDTFVDNRPVANSSSNGLLYGSGPGNAAWTAGIPCVAVSSSISTAPGDFSCTQPGGPGSPINITLNNTNVTFPTGTTLGEVFKFKLFLWVPITDITSGGFTEEFLTNTVTGITGITSVTGLQNYGGTGEPMANNTVNAKIFAIPPGVWNMIKTFDGNATSGSQIKTGGYKAAIGEKVMTTMSITDSRKASFRSIACNNIDTTSFTFAGLPTPSFQNAAYRKLNSPSIAQNSNKPLVYLFPPNFGVNPIPWKDGTLYGASVEYSSVAHTVNWSGAEPQRNSTCEDDLDSNPGTQDWYSDPALVPGGLSAVTKVRLIWKKDYQKMLQDILADHPSSIYMFFSYLLEVKPTVTIGSRLPNYAVGQDKPGPVWFKDTTSSSNPADPGYSFQYNYSDRVTVVGATMSVEKETVPNNFSEVKAGDIVEYRIIPNITGTLSGTTNLTIVDSIPSGMSFIPGSVTTSGTNGTLASIPTSGSILTFTLNNVASGSPITTIRFKVRVDPKLTKAVFRNLVRITSSNTQMNQDSDPACNACATPVQPSDVHVLQMLPPGGYLVRKVNNIEVYEVNTPIPYILRYTNNSQSNYSSGNFIDTLPYNEDQGNYQFRENPATPGDASRFHESNTDWTTPPASQIQTGLATLPVGTNGETFQYTTANPSTISQDPCHSSNQPSGFIPTAGHYCYEAYVLNSNKFVDNVSAGTGATVWTNTPPSNLKTVTAIRWNSTAHNSGTPGREITVTLNPQLNWEGDVYCNSFSGRIPEVSLLVVSNDVCVRVVGGTISGTVWFDTLTNNGTLDSSDDRLSGMIVELLDSAGNSIDSDPLTSGVQPTITTTATNGFYQFSHLKSGTYQTRINNPNPNHIQTYDNDDGILSATYTTPHLSGPITLNKVFTGGVLSDVSDATNIDYGYAGSMSIGNFVWFDTNNNGIVDGSESGVNGVSVNLIPQSADLDLNGTLSQSELSSWLAGNTPLSTTTANDSRPGATNGQPGYYQFNSIAAGSYFVHIPASNFVSGGVLEGLNASPIPSGVGDTQDDNRNHGALPSGASSTVSLGVVSTLIQLSPGSEPTTTTVKTDDDTNANSDTTIDFGFHHWYSVGNRIWFDNDNSGTINGVETGVPNITVNLLDAATSSIISSTTTDASGYYRFDTLPAGNYIIEVPSSVFTTATSPLFRYIPSTNGFELNPNSDVDGNTNGMVVGSNVRTGIITLGILATEPNGETDVAASGQGTDDKFANMTIDLGFIPPAHIGDTVFFDLDGDGIQDSNEPGIPNVTVTLESGGPDGNLATTADNVITTTTTNALGRYDFFSLTPNTYRTTVGTVPGATITTPNSYTTTLDIGEDDLTHDFGFNATGTFGNQLWQDVNQNGIRDAGEPGLEGVQVELFQDLDGDGLISTGDPSLGTTTTDSTGSYLFINLLTDDNNTTNGPGAMYVARVVSTSVPSHLSPTALGAANTNNNNQNASNFGFLLSTTNTSNLNGDFGYIGNSVFGDYVWYDFNGDAMQDSNESPVPNVQVTLVNAGPDNIFGTADDITVGTQTTNASGNYSFTNLVPGNYRATILPSSYVGVLTTPASVDQVLAAGQVFNAGDFGIRGNGIIGNQVWIDSNINGVFNSGEQGIANVAVQLYHDRNNDGVADSNELIDTKVTDTNGVYQFTNVLVDDNITTNGAGAKYIVKVNTATLPPNTPPTILGTPNTDNNNQDQNGTVLNLTSSATTANYLDFGYIGQPQVNIEKTLYEGHTAGAGCPGTDEIVVIDKTKSMRNITYCFVVTNTGATYLDTFVINDPTLAITQANMTSLSGTFPLAPGGTASWYYQTTSNTSITNTADVTARPVNAAGTPTGQANVTHNDPTGAKFIYVFDPPFGIKTGQVLSGQEKIRWTMQWINDSAVTANNVVITDEVPVGTTYAGGLACNPEGATVVLSCDFVAPNTTYPRGAVVVTAHIAPDPGATNVSEANNQLDIIFDVTMPSEPGNIANQGVLDWDPTPNIPNSAFRTTTQTIAGVNEPTVVTVTLVDTGIKMQRNSAYALFVAGGLMLLAVVRRRYSNYRFF